MRLRATSSLRWIVCLALAAAGAGCSGYSPGGDAGAQLRFGVQMAQRGLWNEALFRFHKAEQIDPNNPRILNNLAVAQEAAGRYDAALATYKKALSLAPGDKDLKDNYAHFVDFYQSFRPPNPGQAPGAPDAAAPPKPVEPQPGQTSRHDQAGIVTNEPSFRTQQDRVGASLSPRRVGEGSRERGEIR